MPEMYVYPGIIRMHKGLSGGMIATVNEMQKSHKNKYTCEEVSQPGDGGVVGQYKSGTSMITTEAADLIMDLFEYGCRHNYLHPILHTLSGSTQL
ncbi:hypothetical protein [Enterobacter hormaechei]|uniref:hypothetical protein n=1 Tax=Enterobacter hormaechei TaxID=158836 RepID=UPI002A7585C6|nr:hypothetical protein [Enterobacter hormaechei]MDY3570239.1 hypothetical protein [Enterobacter hormaechei]